MRIVQEEPIQVRDTNVMLGGLREKEGQMKKSLRTIVEILHRSLCVLIVRRETRRGEMRIQSGPWRIMRE